MSMPADRAASATAAKENGWEWPSRTARVRPASHSAPGPNVAASHLSGSRLVASMISAVIDDASADVLRYEPHRFSGQPAPGCPGVIVPASAPVAALPRAHVVADQRRRW